MKNQKNKTGFHLLMTLILFAGFISISRAQASDPYQICNSKNVQIEVEYNISKSGTTAHYGPVTIGPNNCYSIPALHFSAVGSVSNTFDAEVEVIVVSVNSVVWTCTGCAGWNGQPICSSVVPSGLASVICPPAPCPPTTAIKCYDCFGGGNAVLGMNWTPAVTTIW